jgi:hypothetical protein
MTEALPWRTPTKPLWTVGEVQVVYFTAHRPGAHAGENAKFAEFLWFSPAISAFSAHSAVNGTCSLFLPFFAPSPALLSAGLPLLSAGLPTC